jgi:hypothetical protein
MVVPPEGDSMDDIRLRRALLQQLTDRLIVEYAGALPPGQVLAAVVRAERLVRREDHHWTSAQASLCERLARQRLTRQVAPHLAAPIRLSA